jgi:hypothetical protein
LTSLDSNCNIEKEAKMPKRYSAKLKFQIVMELIQGEKTAGKVATPMAYIPIQPVPGSASFWKRDLRYLRKTPQSRNMRNE